MEIRKITSEDIKRYRNEVLKNSSASTFDRKIFSLKKFFDWTVKEGFVDENPVEEFLKSEEEIIETKLGKIEKQRKLTSPSYNSTQAKIIAKLAGIPKLQKLAYHLFYTRPKWYTSYHKLPIASYFNYAVLIILMSGLGYGVYNQFFKTTATPLAYPTSLTRAGRYLSFQGRLTNNLSNPITVSTNMVFKLYNVDTGGTALWDSSTCAITPDVDGIFSILLGSDCGTEIPASVFSENSAIWLGVTVGTDAEATPRVQIATVAYALNAETLQGYPASESATANTIPAINSSGFLVLGSTSPKIQSTSGNFAIEGQTMTITTPDTSNGSVTINPDGTGTLNLTFEGAAPGGSAEGFVNATNANLTSGSLYYGAVASGATGYNLLQLQSGATPTNKFVVDYAGNITASGTINGLTISSGTISSGTWNGTVVGTQWGGTGQNWVGVAQGSIPYFNGTGTMSTLDAGTSGYVLITQGTSANPTWTNPVGLGTNHWQLNSDVLAPINVSNDLAIGGNATASAKFQVFGATGNITSAGTASISGSLTFKSGAASVEATTMSNLTLGGSTTGNVIINSRGSTALTANGTDLTAGGNLYLTSAGNLFLDADTAISDTGLNDAGAYLVGTYDDFTFATSTNVQGVLKEFDTTLGTLSGKDYWDLGTGTIYPTNTTLDLLLGSSATSSAKFAFTGVDSGTPTASVSGSIANVATYLDGNGNLSTTNMNNLTLGSSTTGNVAINSRGSAALTANGTDLTAGGNLYLASAANLFLDSDTALSDTGLNDAGAYLVGVYDDFSYSSSTNVQGVLKDLDTAIGGAGTNHWQLNSNVLAPINVSNDLAIGGNATSSAKFQVFGATGNISTANNTVDWTLNNAVDALNIDSNTLSIDALNNRVGIGTTSPGAGLDVVKTNAAAADIIGSRVTVTQPSSGTLTAFAYRTIVNATHTTGTLTGVQANSSQLSFTGNGGTTSYAEGLTSAATVGTGAIVNDLALAKLFSPSNSGTITNLKGLYLQNMAAGSSSNYSIYSEGGTMYHAGNVGIGTTAPDKALEINSATGNNLRLTYNDSDGSAANYADLTTTSTGDLTITASGGQVVLPSTVSLNAGGLTGVVYNAFAGSGDTPAATTAITASNDLFVGGDTELKGGLYLTGKNIFNVVGGVSTGTITLATDPTLINNYNALSYGSWLINNSTNDGIAALMVNQSKGGDIFTASASGSPKFVIDNAGNVGIGTTGPLSGLDVRGTTYIKVGDATAGLGGTPEGLHMDYQGSDPDIGPAIRWTDGTLTNTFGLFVSGGINFQGNAINPDFILRTPTTDGTLGTAVINLGAASTTDTTYFNAGNVGIGTTAPAEKLVVSGGAIRIDTASTVDNDGRGITLNSDDDFLYDGEYIPQYSFGFHSFGGLNNSYISGWGGIDMFAGSTPRLRIAQNGNVGIGTTAPSSKFTVDGVSLFLGANAAGTSGGGLTTAIDVRYAGGGTEYGMDFLPEADSTRPMTFFNAAAGQVGSIYTTNTATSFNQSSDLRLKENIVNTNYGLSDLLKISVRDFNFISDPAKITINGFIAQDLYQIYPNAVTPGGDDPGTNPWMVDYGRLTPLLTVSIQQLAGQVTSLSGQVANLSLTSNGDLNINQDPNGNYQLTNTADNSIIGQIAALAQLVAANIQAGAVVTKELTTDSFIAFQGTVDNMLVKSGLVATNIETQMITPLADATDITIQIGKKDENTGETQTGKLSVQNADGNEVASIDTAGDATFSGTLYADDIKSRSLDEIKDILAKVETDQALLAQAADWNINTATGSANLSATNLVTTDLLTTNLYVTGQAAMNSLSLSQALSIGTDLVFQSTIDNQNSITNSIDTLTSPLRIQSLAMAPVEIMAGLIKIDTAGNMIISGNLAVGGRVESSGLTLKDKDLGGQSSQATDSARLLTLQNASGASVATVDASGSALFKDLTTQGLTIAGAVDATNSAVVDGVITTNATAGSGIIPAGASEIIIKNTSVTDYTLVYVTPTSSTDNYVLYVKSKSPGEFVVGFTNPIDIDVNFNWWVVRVTE